MGIASWWERKRARTRQAPGKAGPAVFAYIVGDEDRKHGKCHDRKDDMEDVVNRQCVQLIERNGTGFAEHCERRKQKHQRRNASPCNSSVHPRAPREVSARPARMCAAPRIQQTTLPPRSTGGRCCRRPVTRPGSPAIDRSKVRRTV